MKPNRKTSEEFERFRSFVKGIVSVPGAEVKKIIEQEREERARKKRVKKPVSHVSNDRET